MTPQRIQRQRTKGWRMPPNTVYVGRPTGYGNQFRIVDCADAADSVRRFRNFLEGMIEEPSVRANVEKLRGKDLACWCKVGTPCHADVLLEFANSTSNERGENARSIRSSKR